MSKGCARKDKSKNPEVEKLIAKYRDDDGGLVPLLQEAQDLYGYLPRDILEQIAEGIHQSLAKVYGVVTFYSQFHTKPRGKNIIRVCTGTACHVRGGRKIIGAIEDHLGITSGDTSSDLDFSMESVACIGACGLAPVMTVNDDTYGRLTPGEVPEILNSYKNKQEVVH